MHQSSPPTQSTTAASASSPFAKPITLVMIVSLILPLLAVILWLKPDERQGKNHSAGKDKTSQTALATTATSAKPASTATTVAPSTKASENTLVQSTPTASQSQFQPSLAANQPQPSIQPAQLTPKQQYLTSLMIKQSPNDPNIQDKVNQLLAQTGALKQRGASAAELQAMRRQYVDKETAQRLAVLDEAPDDLIERVNQYEQMREQVVMGQGDNLKSQQAVIALQQQLFGKQEQQTLAQLLSDN